MQSVNECFDKVKNDYLKFLNKEKIYKKSMSTHIKNLKQIYIPTAFWINSKYEKKGKTLFIGLSGGQGTGKTTITGILKIILKKFFKRKIHISSIDDFYKNLKERNKMSYEIHPLFKTRGVPGTHDISLLKNFFNFIKKKKFKPFLLPKFDKSLPSSEISLPTETAFFMPLKARVHAAIALAGSIICLHPLLNKPLLFHYELS